MYDTIKLHTEEKNCSGGCGIIPLDLPTIANLPINFLETLMGGLILVELCIWQMNFSLLKDKKNILKMLN